MALDITELQPGDYLTVRDRNMNLIKGEVQHIDGGWFIEAFNTKIEIARDRQVRSGPVQIAGLKIIEWTQQLTNLTEG